MSCVNPSSAFLRAWLEHPGITESQRQAMLQQAEYIDELLDQEGEPSRAPSPSRKELAIKEFVLGYEALHAKRSQYQDDGPERKKPMLRGGLMAVDRAMYDHENALNTKGKPDKTNLAKTKNLAEGDPP